MFLILFIFLRRGEGLLLRPASPYIADNRCQNESKFFEECDAWPA